MKKSLAFYADTPRGQKNKLFTFKIAKTDNPLTRLQYFKKRGFRIKAAWIRFGNGFQTKII